MSFPDIEPIRMVPPAPDVVRSVPGLEALADLIEAWLSAGRDVQAAGDAYRACLPPDGDSWVAARGDAKKAAGVLDRIGPKYGEWSAAVVAADAAAFECARFRDIDNAAVRENTTRLKALDDYLCSLPGSWDVDDSDALIARAEAKREADRLRRSLWAVHQVAAWLALPTRLGLFADAPDHGRVDVKALNGWPVPSLSPVALDRLNALLGTSWAARTGRVA